MQLIKRIFNTTVVLKLREVVADLRFRFCKGYRFKRRQLAHKIIMENMPYEKQQKGLWYPPILSIEETLNKINAEKCGCCRFGDGELEIIAGRDISFQRYDKNMQLRLVQIISSPLRNCICCIPNIFGSLAGFRESTQRFWRPIAVKNRDVCRRLIESRYSYNGHVLGDPHISRPYLTIQDKTRAENIFNMWKEIFAGRDILLVEGRYSRVGIGNDLLAGAKCIQRIWCPPQNAYAHYDRIFTAVTKHAKPNNLILLALGAAATILAYDLCKAGFQALDIGHIDIEYIWMKMKALERVPIPGRYVNECKNGHEMIPIPGEEIANNVLEVII